MKEKYGGATIVDIADFDDVSTTVGIEATFQTAATTATSSSNNLSLGLKQKLTKHERNMARLLCKFERAGMQQRFNVLYQEIAADPQQLVPLLLAVIESNEVTFKKSVFQQVVPPCYVTLWHCGKTLATEALWMLLGRWFLKDSLVSTGRAMPVMFWNTPSKLLSPRAPRSNLKMI